MRDIDPPVTPEFLDFRAAWFAAMGCLEAAATSYADAIRSERQDSKLHTNRLCRAAVLLQRVERQGQALGIDCLQLGWALFDTPRQLALREAALGIVGQDDKADVGTVRRLTSTAMHYPIAECDTDDDDDEDDESGMIE